MARLVWVGWSATFVALVVAILTAPMPPAFSPPVPIALGPALTTIVGELRGLGCGVSVEIPPASSVHRACAPTPDLSTEPLTGLTKRTRLTRLTRQWVTVTKLAIPEPAIAYLVRVCGDEDERHLPTRCTYALMRHPPATSAVDARPYASGTPVSPDEELRVSFAPERRAWVIDTLDGDSHATRRELRDIWTLDAPPGAPVEPAAWYFKKFLDADRACEPGDMLVGGSSRDLPLPRAMASEPLPAAFCIGESSVNLGSYRACAATGACAEPAKATDERDEPRPEFPVRGASAQAAATYCAQRGQTVATPAQILAALDERTANPDRYGRCIDVCPRQEYVAEASDTDTFRCMGAPQVFAIDEGSPLPR